MDTALHIGKIVSSQAENIHNDLTPNEGEIVISGVESASDTSTVDRRLSDIFGQVRTGQGLRAKVESIRETYRQVMLASDGDRKDAKSAIKVKKLMLPAVTWSGRFKERNEKGLIQHSGLLCADLDDVGQENLPNVRVALEDSLHIVAIFSSPSGEGVKAVFRVHPDSDKHQASYRAVEAHVRQLTGLQIDQKCSDVSRLCFLSHDPDIYVNEYPVALPPIEKSTAQVESGSNQGPEHTTSRAPVADDKLEARRKVAAELLGEINWTSNTEGHATCPAKHLHNSGDGERDCIIYLGRVPTVSCFHQSCVGIIAGVNHELRSRIGKLEWRSDATSDGAPVPEAWFDLKFPTLAARFGAAVLLRTTKNGSVYVADVAEDFLAATWGAEGSPETPTIFLPTEEKFYTYTPADGIYVLQRDPVLMAKMSQLLLECGRQCAGAVDTSNLQFRLRASKNLGGVLKKAQSLLAAPDDFFLVGLTEFIPCANGMLRLSDKHLLPFGPNYHRRNKLAVAFNPDAGCPLFLDQLMRPALDHEDLDLVQRWCGLALVGENLAQQILLLEGTAGGGKGTLIRVITGLIGMNNVASLRTRLLGERFEVGRFLGKTLLYGADVPEDFLNQHGASVLKSLVGGDPMTMEFKKSNETPIVTARFNAIVTCNSRLTVHLEGDAEAWRRRLAIVRYEKPKPKEIIANLSESILSTEGPGVLNWMLEGLEKIKGHGWQLHLTARQQKLVDDLLLESEAHLIFAQEALSPCAGQELTVDECYDAYLRFCGHRGWKTLPLAKFREEIRPAVTRLYGLTVRHDVRVLNSITHKRGWKGIYVIGAFQEGGDE